MEGTVMRLIQLKNTLKFREVIHKVYKMEFPIDCIKRFKINGDKNFYGNHTFPAELFFIKASVNSLKSYQKVF